VPEPITDYCTSRVLTMERIDGKKITSVSALRLLELDGPTLANDLFRAYLKQILIDGLFHADPHPGNVFLTSDDRVALLDLGMVGHTTPTLQEHLLKLRLASSEGDSDTAADVAIRISETTENFDEKRFRHRLGE